MKVRILKTLECVEVNDSYGERLIQQGQAVFMGKKDKPEAKKPDMATERVETMPAQETKPAKKR
ncbi:MAG: hypothetical protein IJ649_01095 [Oscillospiraceae bacterium]|nr:hypothetical protein [Oscillospiraceae bacterium]